MNRGTLRFDEEVKVDETWMKLIQDAIDDFGWGLGEDFDGYLC